MDGVEEMIIEQTPVSGVEVCALVVCPLCEGECLVKRHCKLVCERCGYVESCEDNFAPVQAAPDDPVPNA